MLIPPRITTEPFSALSKKVNVGIRWPFLFPVGKVELKIVNET